MVTTQEITSTEDIIDSRDVEERITYLERDEDSLEDYERTELGTLKALREEAQGYCDWNGGTQLIRDTYFEDYAQELAEDIGAISSDAAWPLGCIDWEQAADELKVDYTSVSFDGVDYWMR